MYYAYDDNEMKHNNDQENNDQVPFIEKEMAQPPTKFPEEDYVCLPTDCSDWVIEALVGENFARGLMVLYAQGDSIATVIALLARQGYKWKHFDKQVETSDRLNDNPEEAFFAYDTEANGIMWFAAKEDISLANYLIAQVKSMMKISFLDE